MGAYLFKAEATEPQRTWPRRIVFIEGNISAGKSTLLKALKDEGYAVWTEGVDAITTLVDGSGKNLLELFYADMPRYAFELQVAYLNNRWKTIREALDADKTDIVFVERSLWTDRYTFALQLYQDGCLTDVQWTIYNELLMYRVKDAKWIFDDITTKTIYLQTPPDICMLRTNQRNRGGEVDGITTKYLEGLHDKLEKWLEDENDLYNTDVVNGNQEPNQILQDVLEHLA